MAGTDLVETVKSAAAGLTASFVAGSSFALLPNQVRFILEVTGTVGDATSFSFQLYGSNDGGTTFIPETVGEYTVGGTTLLVNNVYTITAAMLSTIGAYFEFQRSAYPVYQFQFKRTGGSGTDRLLWKVRKLAGQVV